MSLWRLEWLRLLRTHRLLVLVAVYVFFGLTGPLVARYLGQILDRFGAGGVRIELPPPTPADGIAQFTSNATQIGLLVVVIVSASALAFDARPEMAMFLRTRVGNVRDIVVPAYVVSTGAAIVSLILGSLAAWYETAVLLGAPPTGRMLLGIGLSGLFLPFATAGTALAANLVRGTVACIGVTLTALLVMAVLGNLPGVGRWLPTRLPSALPALVGGAEPAGYLPAAGVAIVATVALLAGATALAARREW